METHRRSTSSAPPTAARDLHKRLVEIESEHSSSHNLISRTFPRGSGTPGKLPEFPFSFSGCWRFNRGSSRDGTGICN